MKRIIEFRGAKGGQGASTIAVAAAITISDEGTVEIIAADNDGICAIAGAPSMSAYGRVEIAPNVLLVNEPTGTADYIIYDGVDAPSNSPFVERILIVRGPCYLALRKAVSDSLPCDGFILVKEENRALTSRDVEQVLGAPCLAVVPVTPKVARAIDAGLLVHRLPAELHKLSFLKMAAQV